MMHIHVDPSIVILTLKCMVLNLNYTYYLDAKQEGLILEKLRSFDEFSDVNIIEGLSR